MGASLLISVDSSGGLDTAYLRQTAGLIEVASNPRFTGGFGVAAASISDVVVTGTGGGQALVITAGSVAASLAVAAVERVTFGGSSTVGGDIALSAPGATLAVTDAATTAGGIVIEAGRVELGGGLAARDAIRIDGPVVVVADAAVSSEFASVVFAGSVDGLRPGRQSLSVTAPTTTRFAAPVGGRVPLASLSTRAVPPLAVPQSAASRSLPLHYLPYTTPSGLVEDKYGIEVAIGAGPVRMYEFDTGGTGFMAGYDPAVWPGITPSGPPLGARYTSGNFYDAVAVNAVVTLGRGSTAVSTAGPVQIGAILAGGNDKTGMQFDFLAADPPVEGSFYGDFGASFGINSGSGPGVAATSVLFQLPGNLSSGFVVQLGPVGGPSQLTVGLTPELRAQFPYAVSLADIPGLAYPTSRLPVFEQFGFDATFTLSRDGGRRSLGPIKTLIDSGAPSLGLRLPDWPAGEPYPFSSDGSTVDPGTTVTVGFPAAPGTPPLDWSFVAGNDGSVDLAGYSSSSGQATSGNNVNTGLNLYNAFDVMFDLQAGLVRLRPNGGSATVELGSVTTTGTQAYGQNAALGGVYRAGGAFSVAGATTLAADALVSAGRAVTFIGAIDATTSGGASLTTRSRGATSFRRPIGPTAPLASVNTAGSTATFVNGAATTGAQSYGARTTLQGTFGTRRGQFSVGPSARLTGAAWISTAGDAVGFSGSLDGAFSLAVSSGGDRSAGPVTFGGPIGRRTPLAGLAVGSPARVVARGSVILDGTPAGAAAVGISLADGAVVSFGAGGRVQNFGGAGVAFAGDSPGSVLAGFTISGNVGNGVSIAGGNHAGTVLRGNTIVANTGFGIELAGPVRGLSITRNAIGAQGRANPWGLVSDGPNTHGIVVAPGDYSGTSIAANSVRFNARAGLMAPGGVTGLSVAGNRFAGNGFYGLDLVTGDFSGTVFAGNLIAGNGLTDIALGAGVLPPAPGGDPLAGYAADTGRFLVPYTAPPDFTGAGSNDPQVALRIGTRDLAVNLDTGSRGLYVDALRLDPAIPLDGPRGYVYLNSSNRLYFGTWSTQQVTFTGSTFTPPGGGSAVSQPAVATVPVLVVSAVGASPVPPAGSTVASTTFGTTVATGTVVITDGRRRMLAPIVPVPPQTPAGHAGTVTIPGGWWATYADNRRGGSSILAPVANLGVGFDRSGLGTFPVASGLNQAYNPFLNVAEMRSGAMRAGYVITPAGVTLGLDAAQRGFAYTRLVPTGLAAGPASPPDWQPATGTLALDGRLAPTGPIVIDMGIPFSILTLPGRSPGQSFKGDLRIDLLNSGGRVSYRVKTNPGTTTLDPANRLNPVAVTSFAPLPGVYSQNAPPTAQQFFNTGRAPFSAFAYLYDAQGGYLGLKPIDPDVLATAGGEFAADAFVNPTMPTGVSNLTIR